jgi:hypothetical protein
MLSKGNPRGFDATRTAWFRIRQSSPTVPDVWESSDEPFLNNV